MCGKKFLTRGEYAYRREKRGKVTFFCSWHCLRAYDEKTQKKIGHGKGKDPSRYAKQIMDFISYFFDEAFEIRDEYPAEAAGDAKQIISEYLATYDHSDNNEQWFAKIRDIAVKLGYAAKPKDFKKHPEDYKGHVGHVSTVIRIALMGRAQSPDVWAIQQIMGEEKVRTRLNAARQYDN